MRSAAITVVPLPRNPSSTMLRRALASMPVRVLAHKAKLNGYALEPEQSSGLSSFSIHLHLGEEKE